MKSVKLRSSMSSGQSFLSRLEESQEAALGSSQDDLVLESGTNLGRTISEPSSNTERGTVGGDTSGIDPKAIRWNFNAQNNRPTESSVDTGSSRRKQRTLAAVTEEPEDNDPERPRTEDGEKSPSRRRGTREARREERRRMRSKSRMRQENSSGEGGNGREDGKSKQRTPKWSDLHDSISNLNLSRSSFEFDLTDEGEQDHENAKTYVSVQPKFTPVVLKGSVKVDSSVVKSTLPMGTTTPSESTRKGVTESERWYATPKLSNKSNTMEGETAVGDIINETKERARESRMRQAKMTAPPIQGVSSRNDIDKPTSRRDKSDQKSSEDAMDRLRRANSLILEKKKRREDSKVRQQQLNDTTSKGVRYPVRGDGLTSMVSFHEKKDQDTAMQFTPSLHEGGNSFNFGDSWGEDGSTNSFGEDSDSTSATFDDPVEVTKGVGAVSAIEKIHSASAIEDSRTGKPSVSGLKVLKKGMKFIGKSGRNLIAIATSDDNQEEKPADNQGGMNVINEEKEKSKRRRADREKHVGTEQVNASPRKPRSERKDFQTATKKASKWGDLKKGLDSMKKGKRPADKKPPGDTSRPASFGKPNHEISQLQSAKPKSTMWGSQRKTRSIDDEIDSPEEKRQVSKKPASSRWVGLKGSMTFINKMKLATEEGQN
jgi:hypothetical protein